MDRDRLGTVQTADDGRQYVKFVRQLPHSVERVWHALTDESALARWFPGLQLDCREGGAFHIWFGGACEGPAHVEGTVTTFDPPHELALGGMCWRLKPTGTGTELTFTDFLMYDDRPRTDFANSVLGGWHAYMDALEQGLLSDDGGPVVVAEPDYAAFEIDGRP